MLLRLSDVGKQKKMNVALKQEHCGCGLNKLTTFTFNMSKVMSWADIKCWKGIVYTLFNKDKSKPQCS